MIRALDPTTRASIEHELDEISPSPEDSIRQLCRLAIELPDDSSGARVRLLVAGLVDLIGQTRWHLGCCLHLLREHSALLQWDESRRLECAPALIWLTARAYGNNMSQVMYSDLADTRIDGTAGAWVLQMLVDSAIFRTLAALDRLAGILWVAVGLEMPVGGKPLRVYFREDSMRKIDSVSATTESRALLQIATGPLMTYATDYRDGLAHDFKLVSALSEFRPSERRHQVSLRQQTLEQAVHDGDSLFVLANATYHQLIDALPPGLEICNRCWPDAAGAAAADA